ncbi:MAG: hypothetical protein K0B14_10660 [Anaerolineaceae bacterium]|nr:hypothetical protein [Anaerolineaceae bacterium]
MYLDPGFGSMVLQFILAGILGLGVIVRIFWKNIKGFFHKNDINSTDIKDDIDYGSEE